MLWRMNAGGRMLVVGVSVALVACPALASERTEAVLSWDDGGPDAYCGYPESIRMAVWFQAPEWATSVVAVHVWFGGEWSPYCTVWFYGAAGNWPHVPGMHANEGDPVGQVPGGCWTVIPLAEPVDITDAGHFPDRVFFAGLELETQTPDALGVDTDEPIDGKSLMWNWSEWQEYESGDFMIRAVVSDSSGSGVEVLTWGAVKHLFGGSRLPN